MTMFPKPGKKAVAPIKVFRGDREVCNRHTKAGRDEYDRRKRVMFERQRGICSLMLTSQCKLKQGRMPFRECTFEHTQGRGGGKRDDRIEIDGKPYNSVACPWCNCEKGSRPLSAVLADVVP